MIKVEFQGIKNVSDFLNGVQKQARFAAAVALTRTAGKVRAAMPAVMARELDRPTQFTSGDKSMYVTGAKPDSLTAVVGFKDRQASYLRYQIEGGTRTAGPRGIKLPGNITLDTFGNSPKGVIAKLKASAQDGTLGRGLAKRLGVGKRKRGSAPIQLMFGRPSGSRWKNAPIGIWRRVPGSPGKLVPVIVFPNTAAHYKPRFHFEEAAAAVVRSEWDSQFAKAFDEAMRSAR